MNCLFIGVHFCSGAASPGGRSDMSRQDEVSASPGMLTAAQLARRLRLENERLQVSS